MLNIEPGCQADIIETGHVTHVELDRVVMSPLCSAFVPVPAIFELWSIWAEGPITTRHIRGRSTRRPTLRLEFSQGIQDTTPHEP